MAPKEKAIEIIDKYKRCVAGYYAVKKCALISVDEVIKVTKLHDLTIYQHGRTAYWQEVKLELEKL